MSDYAWSKSSIKSLLENCSWQWALRKVYGIEDHGSPATAMGTGFHKSVEEWEKSGRRMSLEEMQAVAAESAFDECKKLPMSQWFEHATDPEQVIELAKESVLVWSDTPINKGFTIKEMVSEWDCLGSETYWNNSWGNFTLHGYVDTVYENDERVIIVDNKTASSMRRWKYDQDMNLEASVYLALAEKAQNEGLLPDKPVIFQYHVVSAKEGKARVIDMGGLTQQSFDILQASLTEAEAIRKHEAFRPKPNWNLCSAKYCAYFQGCRVDGTLTPYTLTTSNVPNADPISE
jgi:hypothetical protein